MKSCSLAGTLGLSKLIGFYDDNGIPSTGEVHGWFTDDTPKGVSSPYGWHGDSATSTARFGRDQDCNRDARKSDKPTLICCKDQSSALVRPTRQGKKRRHWRCRWADAEISLTRWKNWLEARSLSRFHRKILCRVGARQAAWQS